MASSDNTSLSSFDDLLREMDELDEFTRTHYPDLFHSVSQQQSQMTSAQATVSDERLSFFTGDEESERPAQHALVCEIEEEIPEEIDDDSLQAYFLRQKFEQIPSDPRFEHAPEPGMTSYFDTPPAQMTDDALFLYGLTKVCAGATDEAGNALALMEQRPGSSPLLAFLPAYTSLENGSSRSRLASLVKQRIRNSEQENSEYAMTTLSQQMIIRVMDVILEAEKLQEAGYRNRQEALSKAEQSVRQRLSRL